MLKSEQVEAIRYMYEGSDVFVFLPTGFGKSICFEVLPFLFDYKHGKVGSTRQCWQHRQFTVCEAKLIHTTSAIQFNFRILDW